jgi:hypothetical protein
VVSEGSPVEIADTEWNRLRPVRMSNQENTVLKKAGIIVAVAAAGALALAPLAFAAETVNSPSCTFANGSDSRSEQDVESTSLLGLASTATNATAPVTNQANAPVASCNNVSDVLDSNSNNTEKTITKSKEIDNSKEINKSSETSIVESITTTLGLPG